MRTKTAAGRFYDKDSMPKMPLYANTFLGWKDKKVRKNITVNNKNITLNGKKYHRKTHSNVERNIKMGIAGSNPTMTEKQTI